MTAASRPLVLGHYERDLRQRGAGLWGKLHRRALGDAIAEPDIALEFRMWLVATTRAGPGGHAVFGEGELASLLPRVDRSNGQLGEFSHRHLRNTLDGLKAGGLLATESQLQASGDSCLLLPAAVYEVGLRYGPTGCPVHGHSLSWGFGQWFNPLTTESEIEGIRPGSAGDPGTHSSENVANA
jgi:hypothetical protein